MAIYFEGDKIQVSGYTPLTVYSAPLNKFPANLSFSTAQCLYRKNGNTLELVGSSVLTASAVGSQLKFDLLKLPTELSGTYTMDASKSTYAGLIETANGNIDRDLTTKLSGDVLSFDIPHGVTNSDGIYGGAVSFHLFFTKS